MSAGGVGFVRGSRPGGVGFIRGYRPGGESEALAARRRTGGVLASFGGGGRPVGSAAKLFRTAQTPVGFVWSSGRRFRSGKRFASEVRGVRGSPDCQGTEWWTLP